MIHRVAGWVLAPGIASRLAVDGPDTAGKTTLAGELAVAIADRGRPVVRASIDGFHRPAQERYRQGDLSPEGYYQDSFDLVRLRSELLDPLGPGGKREYRTAVFDHMNDRPVEPARLAAAEDTVLIFDGVFLQRSELASCWDRVVYVDISEEEVLRRALSRDTPLMGPGVRERYLRRYLPAQRLYCDEVRPREQADVVIDNNDPDNPLVVRAPWE